MFGYLSNKIGVSAMIKKETRARLFDVTAYLKQGSERLEQPDRLTNNKIIEYMINKFTDEVERKTTYTSFPMTEEDLEKYMETEAKE